MSNRIFNVNGIGVEMLAAALQLAFDLDGKNTTAKGWAFEPQKGLVLLGHVSDSNKEASKFPAPLTAGQIVPLVAQWLESKEALEMELTGWDREYIGGDVVNERGWRVFCDDWGYVGCYYGAICAITPSHKWYGK